MGQIEKSVSFSAPVRRVFDYVADPAKQPEWFPGLKEVKNVEGAGSTMTYEWVYEASGLRFEGTARY
ncbi:MAG: SRPBCC family protein, partial [Terriglobia bacterium]